MNGNDRQSGGAGGPDADRSPAALLLAEAVSHHQAGQLRPAEDIYRRVLALAPAHATALYNLGIIGLQTSRPDMAAGFIRQAIALDGGNPEWHYHLALASQMRGYLDDAVRHYAHAIRLKPDYAEAYTNIGNVLAQQGKHTEAAARYETVLQLQPDSPETHYNLANVLAQQGRFDDAITHYRRTLSLNPRIAEAHHNYGLALMGSRRIAEAKAAFQQAVALRPDFSAAYASLTRALLAEGNAGQAVAAAALALQRGDAVDAKALFVEALQSARPLPTLPGPGLRETLTRALTERWCRPALLVNAVLDLVAQNNVIQACFRRAAHARSAGDATPDAAGLAALKSDGLLRLLLRSAPVTGVATERLLTAVRSGFLASVHRSDNSDDETWAFRAALAEQCFINGYVFATTPDEDEQLQRLTAALAAALASGAPIAPTVLTIVAAYVRLDTCHGCEALLSRPWPAALQSLLDQQVRQPLEERKLSAAIPALTAIGGGISQAVQAQYEENPYPVWVAVPQPAKPVNLDADLAARFPLASIRPRPSHAQRTDILIAGCGTGQQAVETAQRIENAAVLAVDLSRASLGYAMRQTAALGVTNIEYAQADILALGTLGRSFDAIVSTGVLHHMADPEAGLRALLPLLRPGGFMLLGLYSELARQTVVAAQRHASEHGYRAQADDIRRFRQDIMNLDDGSPLKTVTAAPDFFSISECRDLLFHVQEHRFDLPQIETMLTRHNLEFLGFEIAPAVRRRYAAMFPEDRAMTNLGHWHAFETAHPQTFIGMYQFWAQKRG